MTTDHTAPEPETTMTTETTTDLQRDVPTYLEQLEREHYVARVDAMRVRTMLGRGDAPGDALAWLVGVLRVDLATAAPSARVIELRRRADGICIVANLMEQCRRTAPDAAAARERPPRTARHRPAPSVTLPPQPELGRRLLAAREALGIRRHVLARQLGRRSSTVGEWECGRSTPGPRNWPRLAEVIEDGERRMAARAADAAEEVDR